MTAPLTLPTVCPGGGPFTDLLLQPIRPDLWRVSEHFIYVLPLDVHGLIDRCTVHVPQGFETDLDSVPRWPLIYWLAKGRTVASAVIHDWLYHTARLAPTAPAVITRALVDRIFLLAMRDEGVPAWQRYPIYWAVRAGGGAAWRRARGAV